MQYLVMLYGDEAVDPQPGSPEFDEMLAGYAAFDELAGTSIVGGEALGGNSGVRTIRHDGGAVRVTDGPFAETTEGMGGYYVLEVPTLDDLIELARHIPAATSGAIELRPLVQYFDMSGERPPASEGDVRYLATIHGPETIVDQPGTTEWEQGAAAHGAFAAAAGHALLGGGALQPISSATTVRVRDGELLVTDGPFAESMEVVGGYYVLRGRPADVADVAQRIPVNVGGRVELREIMDMDMEIA